MNVLHDATWMRVVGGTLLHTCWIIAAVGLVLRLVMPRLHTARARHSASLAALALASCAPLAMGVVGWHRVTTEPSGTPPSHVAPVDPKTNPVPVAPTVATSESERTTPTVPSNAPPSARPVAEREWAALSPNPETAPVRSTWRTRVDEAMRDALPWLVAAWLTGAGLFALRPALGAWAIHRLPRIDAPHWTQRAVVLARRLQLRRSPNVQSSVAARSPMLLGWWRPTIVVPASALTGFRPDELDAILLHELEHLRRMDPWVRWMQTACDALYYFHPTWWWISRTLEQAREECCDDGVIAAGADPAVYVRALLQLETARSPIAVAASDGSLVRRVRRLAGATLPHATAGTWWPSLALLLVAAWPLASNALSAQESPEPSSSTVQSSDAETHNALEDPLVALERQRARNEDTYAQVGPLLERDHPGRWMVIVHGEVHGPFDTLDAAADATESDGLLHRFVYRPGVDDGDVDFALSPWITGASRWTQFGRAFQREQGLTIAATQWIRTTHTLACPDGRAPCRVRTPRAAQDAEPAAVMSGLFEGQLAMPETLLRDQAPHRFAVPGISRCNRSKVRGSKAFTHVRIPELEIDTRVVTCLIPDELVALDPPAETEAPEPRADDTWTVFGRVLDTQGRSVEGAQVTVHTGFGTLFRTGQAVTDDLGIYRVDFGPGGRTPVGEKGVMTAALQAATVSASKKGCTEVQLGRQGDRQMIHRALLDTNMASSPGGQGLLLDGTPARIDFVFERSATVRGLLVSPDGRPIPRLSVSITGDELPPSSSVLDVMTSGLDGSFSFDAVPLATPWRFGVRIPGSWNVLETEDVTFDKVDEPNRVIVVFDHSAEPPTVRTESWTDAWTAKLPSVAATLPIQGRPFVEGAAVQWHTEATRGLRGGLAITQEEGPWQPGDLLHLALHVRNESDEVILFESSAIRRFDKLRIGPLEGRFADVLDVGRGPPWPVMRYALGPGEEVVLPYAPIELLSAPDAAPARLDEGVGYACWLPLGTHRAYFRSRFPDTHRNGAMEGDWGGGLYTGEVTFTVIE